MPQGNLPFKSDGDDDDRVYPPFSDGDDDDRSYMDMAAEQLFRESGGRRLQIAAEKLHAALSLQAGRLEQYHTTPFSKQNVRTIQATIEAIERVERQLERWHHLIYPNQKPKEHNDPS